MRFINLSVNLRGFFLKFTQIRDDAGWAFGFAGFAGVAAMQDEPVMGVEHEFIGHAFEQVLLDLIDIFARREAGAVGNAEDMCIHGHCGLAEDDVQNNIGGFAPDAGEFDQIFAGLGDFACVITNQDFGHGDDVFGLIVVQADCFDVLFEAIKAQIQHLARGVGDCEEVLCGAVDAFVCGLGGQCYGN